MYTDIILLCSWWQVPTVHIANPLFVDAHAVIVVMDQDYWYITATNDLTH